jgi:hypothetical protein
VTDGIDLHGRQRERDMDQGLANMDGTRQIYWRGKERTELFDGAMTAETCGCYYKARQRDGMGLGQVEDGGVDEYARKTEQTYL